MSIRVKVTRARVMRANAHATSAGRGECDAPKSGLVETGPTVLVATALQCVLKLGA